MNVGFNERWGQGGGEKRQERKSAGQHSGTCPDCGAERIDHQIGLEATPDAWADSIVEVMAEAWRVLRDDGSLWVEVGDSYVGSPPAYAFPFERTDASWLAALIDGEGSVQIHRQAPRDGANAPAYQVDVSVAMKDKAVVEHAHRITGIGSLSEQNKGEYGTQWDWGVRGQQAARLLRAIYPWLILKRGQAALTVMLADDIAARKFGRHNPATMEALDYREALRQSVIALNRRSTPPVQPIDPAPLAVDPGLGLKSKDMTGAPYLLAFALRRDGWYWRGAYVWEKPDCMPESIGDRCTTSHSTILHFAKSGDATFWTHRDGRGARKRPLPDYRWVNRQSGEETHDQKDGKDWRRVNLWRGRDYFFDLDAIREPFSDYSTGGDGGSYGAKADGVRIWEGGSRGSTRHVRHREEQDEGHVQPTLDGDVPEPEVRGPDGRKAFHLEAGPNSEQHRDGTRWPSLEGRSPRSVWRITTEANSFGLCPACRTFFPERAPACHCGVDVVAHFAVWPHELVGKIIRAATSEAGCCADCGAPRFRRTKSQRTFNGEPFVGGGFETWADGESRMPGKEGVGHWRFKTEVEELGWQPTCACDAATVPCVVLDVFGGSGTTARQARTLGRRSVLIELSPDYAEIASHRLAQQALPLLAAE